MIYVELLNHYQKLGIRPSTYAQGPLRNPEFGIWNLEFGIRNPKSCCTFALMKMMNGFGRLKSIGLLTLLAWLLSFQTYHVITEHSELLGHHHECCDHHTEDCSQSALPESEEDDCQICKLVSLPYVSSEAFESDLQKEVSLSEVVAFYVESSNQQVFYSRGQRGPPVF
jgi:hypothetical protein